MRAIGVSHTACKDEFRRNLRSHSWSVFSFFIIWRIPPSQRHTINPGACYARGSSFIIWGSWPDEVCQQQPKHAKESLAKKRHVQPAERNPMAEVYYKNYITRHSTVRSNILSRYIQQFITGINSSATQARHYYEDIGLVPLQLETIFGHKFVWPSTYTGGRRMAGSLTETEVT